MVGTQRPRWNGWEEIHTALEIRLHSMYKPSVLTAAESGAECYSQPTSRTTIWDTSQTATLVNPELTHCCCCLYPMSYRKTLQFLKYFTLVNTIAAVYVHCGNVSHFCFYCFKNMVSLSFTCIFHRFFFSTLLQEKPYSQKMSIWKELEPKLFLCFSQKLSLQASRGSWKRW